MLVKPIITNVSSSDTRKICSFVVNNNILGPLKVDTKALYGCGYNRMLISLCNSKGKNFASEEISLPKENNYFVGLNILVQPEYRNNGHKNFRFGEILRLASIIEMLENKKEFFKIYSKDTAVYFHSKYEFEPNITQFEERDYALESIKNDKSKPFEDLSLKASKILKETISKTSNMRQRELCEETNSLVKDYIQRVLRLGGNEFKKHPFNRGMDMILKNETIQDKKSFFNNLFLKHSIDYTI